MDKDQVDVLDKKYNSNDWQELRELLQESGIFVNKHTLEEELVESGYKDEIVVVYGELGASETQKTNMKTDIEDVAIDKVIRRIGTAGMGKGRFAQRLADRIDENKIPAYIQKAIESIVQRLPNSQITSNDDET